jgi:hypothetical protein
MADGVNPYVGAARAALGQGLGMGWGDEAEAWLRAKAGQGSYEDNLARIRREYGQYAQERPFISGALEFAGGVAPGVAAMFVPGLQAVGAGQVQRSTLGALGRLAAVGSATGAVSGAGSATEGERLSGAGTGALIGGVLGGAVPVGMRAGKGAYDFARERLAPTAGAVERRALEKLSRAAGEAQMTPQQIERAVLTDKVMGVPSVVANANPALAELAEAVAQRTGRGARTIEETLTRQKAGSRERTYQQTVRGLKPGDYYADEERMMGALRQKANTLYDDAYKVGEVLDPKIQTILETPEVKGAYETARKIAEAQASLARIRGEDPAQFALREIYTPVLDNAGKMVELRLSHAPDVRTLDYMKRALDAKISAGYASEDAATRANTAVLKQIRNELRDTLKDRVPEYGQALRGYAGDMEVIDAMRRGYNDFGKMDHEQIIKMVAGMSQSEKEAFRTGVARDLYSSIMKPSNDFNAAKRLVGPEMQVKLQPLFDNPAEFELFRNALTRESQLFNTANRVLGGSQTGKRLQMREALEEGPGMGEAVAQAVTGGFWSSLTGMAARAIRAGEMSERTAARLAEMLMSKDPTEVAAVVRALEQHAQSAAPRAVRASKAEAGAGTGTTTAIFPAPSPGGEAPSIESGDIDAAPQAPAGPDIEADIEAELKKRQ